jgi:hypothetical protein
MLLESPHPITNLRIRESDAQDIAMEAIAQGDPSLATAMFGLNLAGEFSGGMTAGCFTVLLLGFHFIAITVVSALDAYFMFRVPLWWSGAIGVVIALAMTQLVRMSSDLLFENRGCHGRDTTARII